MFSSFFVRRPVFAWVIAILIMLAGVLAIRDAGSPYPYPDLDDDPDLPRLARAGQHRTQPSNNSPAGSTRSNAAVKGRSGGSHWLVTQ